VVMAISDSGELHEGIAAGDGDGALTQQVLVGKSKSKSKSKSVHYTKVKRGDAALYHLSDHHAFSERSDSGSAGASVTKGQKVKRPVGLGASVEVLLCVEAEASL
jgi:hypothetical protein